MTSCHPRRACSKDDEVNGPDGPPLVAVLDYGIGNLRSAQKGFERAGADVRLTSDPALIADAAGVVLPGVGHFGAGMRELRAAKLDELALTAIESDVPFLGICVGMQMLFEGSEEAPGVEGLGVLPGVARRLPDGLTRPQMQWNQLDIRVPGCQLLEGIEDGTWMYFVHSYAVETQPELVVATCEYGIAVTAMIGRGSLWATQFHPEKSGDNGRVIAQNFLSQLTSS